MPATRFHHWICFAVLYGLTALASAQPVYRCGNSYSQVPCAGASVLAVDDGRSAEQKAQTDAATAQALRQADRMERERLALERSVQIRRADPKAPPPAHAKAAKPVPPRVTAARKNPEPAYFTATSRAESGKPGRAPAGR